MQYEEGKLGRVFVLRLESGDRIPETIEDFAGERGITRAAVFYVGGAADGSHLVVGPETRVDDAIIPLNFALEGHQETLAVGTLFPDEAGKPLLHMHAGVGREGRATVGCTRAGVDVWLVGEVVILELAGLDAFRQKDPATGFQLLRAGGK